ncbi:NADP-dependent oxidoreductase [Nocardioides sp. LHG3406-4]|uniref:NADP-dependent oxidoreductase n=1 Tax=Nocardioides sp. LHG3406-4 TaxID=2804575 RepID=UPI003CF9D3F4
MRIYGFTSYGGPDVQAHLDVPEPEVGSGQLLVEMTAAGVNPADIKVRSGLRKEVAVAFPMPMGREAAGVVTAVGEGVTGFVPGQRVFGQTATGTGALAERVLLAAGSSAVVPDGVEDAQATCIPVSIGTAYDALDQLGLAAGETLLVMGAGGGVGTATCALARLRGVRVVGVASVAKAELVTELGATHVVSGDGWPDRVRAVAPGGVDAVFDLVGTPVLADAFELAAVPSRVISIAAASEATEAGGSGVERRRTTEVFTLLVGLVAAGELSPVVSATYPFDQAADAVAQVETGHTAGNVVVVRSRQASAPAGQREAEPEDQQAE